MLHFEYPLCVCSFLSSLMFSVAGRRCRIPVGGGVGVEDSYIKKEDPTVGQWALADSESDSEMFYKWEC